MTIAINPLTGGCGAQIDGVSLAQLSNSEFDSICSALGAHGALFMHNQQLNFEELIELGQRFGPLEKHQIVDGMEEYPEIIKVLKPAGERAAFGTAWHSDNTFQEKPSMGSILYSQIIPPYGGDTLFANQMLAYETLSDKMKSIIADLQAVHSAGPAYTMKGTQDRYDKKAAITYTWHDSIKDEVVHPVVRTHPVTGRKALFVNDMFTQRFKGMSRDESAPLLNYLRRHATRPEFCCRFRWQENTVAIWDNRIVQHYAVNDYQDYERLLYRVTIEGEKPV